MLVGFALLLLAVLMLLPAGRGLDVTRELAGHDGALPVRVYVPRSAPESGAPGVVVAHGFAGSAMLMHTWSLALAHAGFVVVAPDLPGHGASRVALAGRADALSAAITVAAGHLATIPEVDVDRLAVLGHSMGSGAALAAAVERVDLFRAVVAVSPTDADVSPTAPRDLLLLAGANEARFVANAQTLLERAGGAGGVPGEGDARSLLVIPRVEHVSILFARSAHDASIAWLSTALGHAPAGRAPSGPLAGWFLLVLAIIALWQGLVVQAATPAPEPTMRSAPWVALPVGGVAATASLVIIARSLEVADLVGVLVAGEVGLWFLMAGTVWLRFGLRPAVPDARDVGWALLVTLLLVGLGASTTLAWTPWWLSGVRITTAVVLTVLLLPFSIAAAAALHGRRGRSAFAVWFVTSGSVLVTLGAAAVVVPGVGFLILVLPLLPVILAAITAVSVGVDRPWATGPAAAVFLGWLLAMLFPLA